MGSRPRSAAMLTKGKYMPLSEANVSPAMVSSYDGQYLCVSGGGDTSSNTGTSTARGDVRYCMGNYLGGGIAGVVYEAFDRRHARHVAIKILNPVGYKLCAPAALRRAEVVKSGTPVLGSVRGMTLENVYWVSVPNRRDLVACYVDARASSSSFSSSFSAFSASASPAATMTAPGALGSGGSGSGSATVAGGAPHASGPLQLRELTLEMCVSLWLLDADLDDDARGRRLYGEDPVDDNQGGAAPRRRFSARRRSATAAASRMREERKVDTNTGAASDSEDDDDEDDDDDDLMMNALDSLMCDEEVVVIGDVVHTIPKIPAKYKAFLESRKTIYREIAHMHKLTGNSVHGQVGGGHENVLKLYDVLEYIQPSKSTIFLVLELAHGGELFDRIRSDNGVEEAVARGYFAQLLSGVLYCHQLGIAHRDLKPENLLLSDADVLKIADFGLSAHFIAAVSNSAQDDSSSSLLLARSNSFQLLEMDQDSVMTPARFRRLNSIVGSPHYVAPEVLQNARYGYEGRKADMWSIGVILYGLLVGNLPFGKELQTCPRYLKFCEWIRSLPSDSLTGKLVYDAETYNPGPVTRSAPTILSQTHDYWEDPSGSKPQFLQQHHQQQPTRLAQVFPSLHQHSPVLAHATSLWSNTSTASKPPASAQSVLSNDASPSALIGAGGRRGSRAMVAFPSWFFPAKLSPPAVHLLASLLHPDPARRYSCDDAYKSSWVADLPTH